MENAPKARYIKHCTNCKLAGHTRPKWPLLNSLNRVPQNLIRTAVVQNLGLLLGVTKTQIRKQRQNDIENKSYNDFESDGFGAADSDMSDAQYCMWRLDWIRRSPSILCPLTPLQNRLASAMSKPRWLSMWKRLYFR